MTTYGLLWGSFKGLSSVAATSLTFDGTTVELNEGAALPTAVSPTWILAGPSPREIIVVCNGEIQFFDCQVSSNGTITSWVLHKSISCVDWKRIVHGTITADGRTFLAVDYGASQLRSFSLIYNAEASPLSTVTYQCSGGYKPLQSSSHPHGVYQHPFYPWVYVTDAGSDRIHIHQLDQAGELKYTSWVATAPGTGPRHLAIHPSGQTLYTINEISLTASTFAINQDNGSLSIIGENIRILPPSITLEHPGYNKPDGSRGMEAAEILIPRDGKQAYMTYRGAPNDQNDGIAILDIESAIPFRLIRSSLRFVSSLGKCPRGMQFEPRDQRLLALANQNSDK